MEMGWTAPPAGIYRTYSFCVSIACSAATEDFDYVRFRFAIVHEFDEFWADQRTEMLEEGPATSKASGIITIAKVQCCHFSLPNVIIDKINQFAHY